MNFSSTSSDPPHDVLRQGALDGTLPEKNAPPSAEVGSV